MLKREHHSPGDVEWVRLGDPDLGRLVADDEEELVEAPLQRAGIRAEQSRRGRSAPTPAARRATSPERRGSDGPDACERRRRRPSARTAARTPRSLARSRRLEERAIPGQVIEVPVPDPDRLGDAAEPPAIGADVHPLVADVLGAMRHEAEQALGLAPLRPAGDQHAAASVGERRGVHRHHPLRQGGHVHDRDQQRHRGESGLADDLAPSRRSAPLGSERARRAFLLLKTRKASSVNAASSRPR